MSDRPSSLEPETLFLRSLKEHFERPTPPPTDAEVAALLRRVRGGSSKRLLRVVAPEEMSEPVRRAWVGSRVLAWCAVAAVLAVAGMALWFSSKTPQEPAFAAQAVASAAPHLPEVVAPPADVPDARSELVLSAGEVQVDGAPVGRDQAPLSSGQRVTTAAGQACLTVDPRVDVCLGPDSEVEIGSLAENDMQLEVVRGTAVAQLSKLPAGHVFALTAAGLRAQAIGTVFQVVRSSDREAAVTVLSGTVAVGMGVRAALSLPEHTRVDVELPSGVAGERQTVSRVEETAVWGVLAHAEWWEPTEVGLVEVVDSELGGAPTRVSIDGQPALPLPIRVLMPLGEHEVVVRNDAGVELGRHAVLSSPSHPSRLDLAQARAAKAVPRAQVQDAAALLRTAREQRSSGQSAAALATYQRLRRSHPASAEATTVLVPMGKLQLGLGQPTQALTSFDQYLGSGGPLAPEALGGKIAALRSLGRPAEERAAIRAYLSRYPRGFAAPRLRARLTELSH